VRESYLAGKPENSTEKVKNAIYMGIRAFVQSQTECRGVGWWVVVENRVLVRCKRELGKAEQRFRFRQSFGCIESMVVVPRERESIT
jgi:hypothetical protein